MALRFRVAELQREIEYFLATTRTFLAPGTTHELERSKSDLTQLARSHGTTGSWQVRMGAPLRTRLSYGDYMPDSNGALGVFGEITFIWDMVPHRPPGDSRPAEFLDLIGRASTVIRILEGDPENAADASEIAMWRMEIADDASPGAYFHVQVLGHEIAPPFPKALDIPRLPGLLVSPLAAAEFAIAELFQDEWHKHSSRASGNMKSWGALQARRTRAQLAWQMREIDSYIGSPWASLKRAQPPADLFLD